MSPLTPELLLRAYAAGIFPMAERHDDDSLFWINPERRGVLPLDGMHVPRRLRKTVRKPPDKGGFDVRIDHDFRGVLEGCAERKEGRTETWINDQIFALYMQLFSLGFGHSIECWRDGKLVGGLYGVAMGAAFFGESMFTRERDASKVALIHLVARLRHGGFILLDTQFVTDHLQRFGAEEIPRSRYLRLLADALERRATFYSELPEPVAEGEVESVLRQSSTQTS